MDQNIVSLVNNININLKNTKKKCNNIYVIKVNMFECYVKDLCDLS
jgi:hypothetical protein